MEIAVKEILKLKTQIYDVLAEHTGKSREDIWNDCERDSWMTADEAKDYGIIDMVLRKKQVEG